MVDQDISGLPKGGAVNSSTKDAEVQPVIVVHQETSTPSKPKGLPGRDLDVAMALFDTPEQIHEPRDPQAERRLVRKIDLMILPYLAVCYAFFYIDKTTLSYAGERERANPPPTPLPMSAHRHTSLTKSQRYSGSAKISTSRERNTTG